MNNHLFDLDVEVKVMSGSAYEGLSAFCLTSTCFTHSCLTGDCLTMSCVTGQNMCGYSYAMSC